MMKRSSPFFSIGVTTYKRPDLLRQCVRSIISQTFSDYEILIGNDDPSVEITQESLGYSDERIRVINNPRNLNECRNMNNLLAEAKGKYFTWIADDDLFEPDFLQTIYHSVSCNNPPKCVMSTFKLFYGQGAPEPSVHSTVISCEFSGSQFLEQYFSGAISIIGVYAVFDIAFLRALGGHQNPASAPRALFGEYLLILKLGSLDRIIYLDAPLVLYRVPEDGGGAYNNCSFQDYKMASRELVVAGASLFSQPDLSRNFIQPMSKILYICLSGTIRKGITEYGISRGFLETVLFFWEILKSLKGRCPNKYLLIVAALFVGESCKEFTYISIQTCSNGLESMVKSRN